MDCYMYRNPHRDLVAPHQGNLVFIERKRILLQMMANRGAVRVITAPALFGKSILAYQYAKIVFAAESTVWISVDDPRFTRDLDAGVLSRSVFKELKKGPSCDLVVLDAVPSLSPDRYNAVLQLISDLAKSEREVVVTTRHPYEFSGVGFSTAFITAHDLVLDSFEQAQAMEQYDSSSAAWVQSGGSCIPAAYCDCEQGMERFFATLKAMSIVSLSDAVLVLALIFQQGSQSLFARFFKDFEIALPGDYVQRHPHAGFRNHGFHALELQEEDRLSLLWIHLKELVARSLFRSEKEFINALVVALEEAGDSDRLIVPYHSGSFRTDSSSEGEGLADQAEQWLGELSARRIYPMTSLDSAKVRAKACGMKRGSANNQGNEVPQASETAHGPDKIKNAPGESSEILNESTTKESCESAKIPSEPLGLGLMDVKAQGEMQVATVLPEPIIINLFGRFEIKRAGKSIPANGDLRKLAKILIVLLTVNYKKDLTRRWIEQAVWPETYTSNMDSNFYNLWGFVKRTLTENNEEEKRLLRRSRNSISLRGLPVESDVQKIDQLCAEFNGYVEAPECNRILTQIKSLYKGPLMPGEENAQIEAYRVRYQKKVLDVLVEGVRILFRQNEKFAALQFAAFAFEVDCTREDVCYTYMDIQKRLGQNSAAMATYQQCRSALIEKYGIDAPRRLDALYREILNEVS